MGQFKAARLLVGHNNPPESASRLFVVGRKTGYLATSPPHPCGAHASAAIYSLTETAKASGLSPYELAASVRDIADAWQG